MSKKIFVEPELTIVKFESNDVITTSVPAGWCKVFTLNSDGEYDIGWAPGRENM